MEDKFKEVMHFGLLVTNYGEEFYLMSDKPIDKEFWMTDDVKMFLVAAKHGKVKQIIVQGFTLFPGRGTVSIRKDDEEEVAEAITFEDIFKDEPVSLYD